MYTLIPEQTAKYLKKEYRVRVLILLFLFLSLGIWVGIVTLFPSYVFSVLQEKKAVAEVVSVEQKNQSASTTSTTAQIIAANAAVTTLQKSQDTLMISSIIEEIANRRVSGVTITNFQIGRTGSTDTNIVIGGKAATRNELVAFENNLTEDTRFSKVYLPVSYLAADTDISYTMNLTGIQ